MASPGWARMTSLVAFLHGREADEYLHDDTGDGLGPTYWPRTTSSSDRVRMHLRTLTFSSRMSFGCVDAGFSMVVTTLAMLSRFHVGPNSRLPKRRIIRFRTISLLIRIEVVLDPVDLLLLKEVGQVG